MKILTFVTIILINLFECICTVDVLPNNSSALIVLNGQAVGNDTVSLIDQLQNELILANQNVPNNITSNPLNETLAPADLAFASLAEFQQQNNDANVAFAQQTENGDTALHAAAEIGDIEEAKAQLANGTSVNVKNSQSLTPLHFASDNGHAELVQMLLDVGADSNAKSLDLRDPSAPASLTPLHFASIKGFVEIARKLLAAGANVDAIGPEHTTPLLYAAIGNHTKLAEFLLNEHADINSTSTYMSMSPAGMTSLHWAIKYGNIGLARELIRRGANPEATDSLGLTPLLLAIVENQDDIAMMLMKAGVNVNATMRYGDSLPETPPTVTALHLAAIKGNSKIIDELIKRGAAVDARDIKQRTALHLASNNGYLEAMKSLLDAGADVNATANWAARPDAGWPEDDPGVRPMVTALHFAAFKGHTEAAKLLLSRGADLEAKDFRHLTALHLAARNGHKELLKYLLDSGAEVNGKVNYLNDLPGVSPKATAMDFAEHLDPEIVDMLKNHGGVKSDTESTFKRYFLIYAIGLTVIIAFGLWFVRSKLKWCKT